MSFALSTAMTSAAADSLLDSRKLARAARLRYVSDSESGFSRRRNGRGFYYANTRGGRIHNETQVQRIDSLAIPPAWADVWICRFANGHLQATGFDDRHRKQYLYHERWRTIADSAKFLRLADFGRLLPKLRQTIARDLRGNELSSRRVLAGMVGVLDATSIRIGNEEYVRANKSYGLTTLRTRHVVNTNSHVELRFRAKGGFHREAVIDDKRLVKLLKQLRRLPKALVFQFRDDVGDLHRADSNAVNDYLREATGHHVTAKDFRTWKASALAAGQLYDQRDLSEERDRKHVIKETIVAVAESLGNTPAVCRKSYIHPGLLSAFESGDFAKLFRGFHPRRKNRFSRDEQIFARFLRVWKPPRKAG
jgi:DNA topoisomerase-1